MPEMPRAAGVFQKENCGIRCGIILPFVSFARRFVVFP